MSIYYPAPYGGYGSLLTLGNTYLAKDSGSFVQWGKAQYNNKVSKISSDSSGSITLAPSSKRSIPTIGFMPGNIYMSVKYDCPPNISCNDSAKKAAININSDFSLPEYSFRSMCEFVSHKHEPAIPNYTYKTFCGGNARDSLKYIVIWEDVNHAPTERAGVYPLYLRPNGNMVCCKITVG